MVTAWWSNFIGFVVVWRRSMKYEKFEKLGKIWEGTGTTARPCGVLDPIRHQTTVHIYSEITQFNERDCAKAPIPTERRTPHSAFWRV